MIQLNTLICLGLLISTMSALADVVVEDQGVSMSKDELAIVLERWTPDMLEAATVDSGDRLELLNIPLRTKKMAAESAKITPEVDPKSYWELQVAIQDLQARYVRNAFLANLAIPDMSLLAEERYLTQKDRFALVPEERYSSHIVLVCPPLSCDRDARRPEAATILAKLEDGADFRELVTEYSEGRNVEQTQGSLGRWLKAGEPHVDPSFVDAVFSIEEVGGHTQVIDTKFGLHIVFLDDLRPAYYKPFEEVEAAIIEDLTQQYTHLAALEFEARYMMSEQADIDDETVMEMLVEAAENQSRAQ